MALAEMKTTHKKVGSGVEILWNSHYVGRALTLDTTAFTDGVCKAGTPISGTGTIANTADVMGILLEDVYEERPQGTVVYDGTINTAVAEAHSGVTIAEAAKTALPKVTFF